MTDATPSNVPAFAVVGRVNKGKSSVVSTLVEDDTVRVDKEPGTTRACTRFPFRADDGRVLCYAIDTPGFEEAPRALAWLKARERSAADRPALVAAFVDTFKGGAEFADECALLTPILAGAAILYVVDASLPYRPNYEAEMEILRWTGRARMALINRIGGDDHIDEWTRALGQYFNVVRVFDAHRSGFTERIGLLRAFRELDDGARTRIDEAITVLAADWARRRDRAGTIVAELIADAVTFTSQHPLGEHEAIEQRQPAWEAEFLAALRTREQRARREIERVYRHDALERDEASLAREAFEWDLFAQASRRVFGLDQWQLVRAGAIGGAAIGGTIDAATLGHSFLLGTIIGGVVGGFASWIGTEQAVEVTVLGQNVSGRVATIGPLGDPQFPWILLDRALLHFASVVARAHAKRDPLKVEASEGKQGTSSVLDNSTQGRIGGLFTRIRSEPAPVPPDLIDALAGAIVPLMSQLPAT
ncbi:MAG: DUF3482 domain-containing protein [Candidatus Binatia bacterium]